MPIPAGNRPIFTLFPGSRPPPLSWFETLGNIMLICSAGGGVTGGLLASKT
jgi:hypothetical protein